MNLIKIILFLFCSCTFQLVGQDTLFYENFENGNQFFELNTLSQGSTDSGSNHWVVNNSYTGGSGTLECLGFPFDFSIPNTAQQPAYIVNSPSSNYLHISSLAAEASGINNASFISADGFCNFEESYFAEMNLDIDASDFSEIKITFDFMNASSLQFEAKVFYSTNSGLTWVQAGPDISPNTNNWTGWEHQDVFFNNQAFLRFGFQFRNVSQLGAEDPPLSIDEIRITGIKECEETGIQLQSFLCSGDSILVNGNYLSESGVYIDTLQNAAGCDSIIVNSLSVNPTYNNPTDTVLLCVGDSVLISGVPIYASGEYTELYQTDFGCDSTSHILVVLDDSELELSLEESTISANEGFNNYQWFDCSTGVTIPGETNSTFSPDQNGDYGVIASNENCEIISDCLNYMASGINQFEWNLDIYPNPIVSELNIDSFQKIERLVLYNNIGQTIYSKEISSNRISINMEKFAQGTYILELHTFNGQLKKRVIKI